MFERARREAARVGTSCVALWFGPEVIMANSRHLFVPLDRCCPCSHSFSSLNGMTGAAGEGRQRPAKPGGCEAEGRHGYIVYWCHFIAQPCVPLLGVHVSARKRDALDQETRQ